MFILLNTSRSPLLKMIQYLFFNRKCLTEKNTSGQFAEIIDMLWELLTDM